LFLIDGIMGGDMDLKQLAALAAIADHGSFSAAARALHTVQSNVSTHIARLERELDATLVDRATGHLTEEGEAVVARARRVQAELDGIEAEVASMTSEVSGTVRVGVIGTTARWLVPRLLEHMGLAHPKVNVVVVDATTTLLVPRLASGQLDLAIVNLLYDEPDVDIEPLFDEEHIVVLPPKHPLFERERVTLAELADHPLLLAPPGTVFRDELDADAAAAGVTLRPQAEIDGLRLLASLAFQGFGAAIVPASAAPSWVGGTWRRLGLDGVHGRSVGLARRHRVLLAAPARALREVLIEVVREDAPSQPGIHVTAT
jgi:LysR family hydrogen peroxide-inducible transcriptional activator